jgi:creatinine amidohydrolase
MPLHLIASLSWPEVRACRAGRTVAILPVGAIEAHGPHLPLATDVIIAEAMARRGAERLAARDLDVLLLPALPFAPAPFAAGFAGTLDVPSQAVTAMVAGIARSLARHGVCLTAVASAHLDPANVGAIRAAAGEVEADGAAALVFPDLTRRRLAERLGDEFASGACHAGRYEGSVVLAERPEWVRREVMRSLAPNPRSLVDAIREGRQTFADAGGPEAYFGFPAEATAGEGRAIVEALGAIVEDAVMEALDAPARRWLR